MARGRTTIGNSAEELELLDALLAGEQHRWNEFVRRYERLIGSCVLKVMRRYGAAFSSDDVDDLVGEAWLALLRDDMRKLRQYRRDRGFRIASWIGLIATNLTIDALRARAAHARPLEAVKETSFAVEAVAPPDARLCGDERAALARAALGTLSPDERAFVVQCFHDERPPEEMARALGVSINTIYSRKFKLREKLVRSIRALEKGEPPVAAA